MAFEKRKRIIIIEGPDATGKTTLCNMIQEKTEGKCHLLHSNYDKAISHEAHWRQHVLFWDFAQKQFAATNYTGNHTVIFDRCYLSDMMYGQISYGSDGTLEEKQRRFLRLANKVAHKDISLYFVHCKPSHVEGLFKNGEKEELLTFDENDVVVKLYDEFFASEYFATFLAKTGFRYLRYDFTNPANIQHTLESMHLI